PSSCERSFTTASSMRMSRPAGASASGGSTRSGIGCGALPPPRRSRAFAARINSPALLVLVRPPRVVHDLTMFRRFAAWPLTVQAARSGVPARRPVRERGIRGNDRGDGRRKCSGGVVLRLTANVECRYLLPQLLALECSLPAP